MIKSRIKKIDLGSYNGYIITFKDSLLQVISDIGCNPNILQLGGQKVLDGNEDIEKLQDDFLCKGDFLAPFPNRVNDGKYSFQGQEYQLIRNETARGHALHGFLMKKVFTIAHEESTDTYTKATFRTAITKSEFQGYPFDIEINLTFTLSENALEIQMKGKNIGGSDAPFGVGWHPYLTVGRKIDECKLRIPAQSIMEVSREKELIPTGIHKPNEFGTNSRIIDNAEFDTCFIDLIDQAVHFENIELWMDETMKYLQSYTPEDRMTIAIEPMSCSPDAFNNGLGLKVLKPMEEVTYRFGIRRV